MTSDKRYFSTSIILYFIDLILISRKIRLKVLLSTRGFVHWIIIMEVSQSIRARLTLKTILREALINWWSTTDSTAYRLSKSRIHCKDYPSRIRWSSTTQSILEVSVNAYQSMPLGTRTCNIACQRRRDSAIKMRRARLHWQEITPLLSLHMKVLRPRELRQHQKSIWSKIWQE